MSSPAFARAVIKPVSFDPSVLDLGPGLTRRVTSTSPLKARRVVYHIATYFSREFGYALQYGYDGLENDPDHRAFVWDKELFPPNGNVKSYAVGACCFRLRRSDEWKEPPSWAGESYWALQWVWLHPFFRGRGLLSHAWGGFRQEFGDFHIEDPYSAAMWSFMRKHATWMYDRIPDWYVRRNDPFASTTTA